MRLWSRRVPLQQGCAAIAVVALIAGCGGGTSGPAQQETVQITIGEGARADQQGLTDGGGEGRGVDAAARELPGNCPGEKLEPEEGNLGQVEQATACLINAIRGKRDLRRLESSTPLARAATDRSRHMDSNDYFAHVAPDGSDVASAVRETGYLSPADGWRLAENIGWGSDGAAQPAAMVSGWMGSKSHRRNILHRSVRDLGVGVVSGAPDEGAEPGAIYTTIFGSP